MQSEVSAADRNREASRWRRALEPGVIAVVLILLVVVGLADYRSTQRDSARLTCLSNMRAIMHEATIYAGEAGMAEASLGVDQLLKTGMITERTGHCPLGRGPGPDYLVTIRDGRPVAIVCTVHPQDHVWVPEKP